MDKVRWGILSTAKIGTGKVIPGMQQGKHCAVVAIGSRNIEKAREAAAHLDIPKAYGSYEALLADADIDAVYIPLPNHMHVKWSIHALEAGKHVLCEKPVALDAGEAEHFLQATRGFPKLKVMEAFMYRHHPQWKLACQLVQDGEIGELRAIQSFFSYHLDDPQNIRNIPEYGGGGLMDIGCYNISLSRLVFASEPQRVFGWMEMDPDFHTDRQTSGILEFEKGTSTFTCATQLAYYQRVQIFGVEGFIEIEIPFNAPPDRPTKVWLNKNGKVKEYLLEICNQYTIQGDLFSLAVLNNTPVPTPLEDAVANMKVIDRVKKSAQSGEWA